MRWLAVRKVSVSGCRFGTRCIKFVTGLEKKITVSLCLHAVLMRVEHEIRLVRERLEKPEWFAGHLDDGPLAIWKSENPKMEMAELALGICLAKVLWSPRGKLMGYDEIIKLVERVFGMKLPNYRELKRDIFGRLKDVAVFSKQLVFLIEQAKDEKDARRH